MRKLPFAAQIYIAAIFAAGMVCVLSSAKWFLLDFSRSPLGTAIALTAAIIAGGKKIVLPTRLLNSEGTSMTLGFGVVLVSMVCLGPGVAVLASMLACLSGCLYPKRYALHQTVFNVSLAAVEATAGAGVYRYFLTPDLAANSVAFFVLVTSSALCYYSVNTFGVSIVLGLCEKASPLAIWKEDFVWSAPGYFAIATITALGTLMLRGSNAGLMLFLLPVVYLFFQFGMGNRQRMEEQKQHEADMRKSEASLSELYLAAIKSLALAIDAKDQYTHQHIIRVQRYSVAIAKEMGLTGSELEAVNTGALLHDIGKIGVPEYVLMKPGRLSAEEFDMIKKHPEIGAAILDPVEFPWPVLPVVRSHHEKWDGTGYPDGLKGEEIPLTARIMAAADVYDALTSTRSYRTAWAHEKAVQVITKDAGTHFDPIVVDAFLKVIDGVVAEMALVGEGPLAPKVVQPYESLNKTAQAAVQIRQASTELYALHEVMRSLSERLPVDELVESLCRKLHNIYPDALFVVLLGSAMDRTLVARAARGVNAEFFQDAKPVSTTGVTAGALYNGSVYAGQYNQEDLMLSAVQSKPWKTLETQVVAPMCYQGREVGTLNCYHVDAEAFSDQDILLLETVGRQAAQAIYSSLLQSRLQNDGDVDTLTGAWTLKRLGENIERERDGAAGADRSSYVLICTDVDAFGAINDVFGHDKGDAVLCGVAATLRKTFREHRGIARCGADQFVAVLPKSSVESLAEAERQVLNALTEHDLGLYHLNAGHIHLSLTFGMASFPDMGGSFASVFLAAERDLRMRTALKKLSDRSQPAVQNSEATEVRKAL